MDITSLTEKELSEHIYLAFSTASGQVLKEFLRTHCYMQPSVKPAAWNDATQVEFRYGRMTLFQLLEYFEKSNPIGTKE